MSGTVLEYRERGGAEVGTGERAGWAMWVYLVVLGVGLAVSIAGQWPTILDFKMFAFYDMGSVLRVDRLLADGLRPTVDFAYSYGLLPLLIDRGWFAVLGRTPVAYAVLTVVLEAGMVWGMARLARAWRWNWLSIVFGLMLLPYAIQPSYLSLTHPMEAVLLIHALAEQARGRRERALALATVCLFVKPSLAYVYGLMLVVLIVAEAVRNARRNAHGAKQALGEIVRQLVPAALTGLGLAAVLSTIYGMGAVANTLLPLAASKSYKAAGFGFFTKVGRQFWVLPNLEDYVTTPAGFWLVAVGITVVGGVVVLAREAMRKPGAGSQTLEGSAGGRGNEALVCAIALHVVFVVWFYAWAGSWTYYSYLLVLAVVELVGRVPVVRLPAVGLLAMLAMAGQSERLLNAGWKWTKPRNNGTAWLWADKEIEADWVAVKRKLVGKEFYFLGNGYATDGHWREEEKPGGLLGGVNGPKSWFLSPGLNLPGEMERIRADIAEETYVLRLKELEDQGLDPWLWPELAQERGAFEEEWRGDFFIIMRRKAAE